MTITITINKPQIISDIQESFTLTRKLRQERKMIEASRQKLAAVPQASYYSQIWA